MAFNTFTPARAPDPGTTDAPEAKFIKTEFGDGYSALVPDGVNNIKRQMDLEWSMLTPTGAKALIDFFVAQNGQPFWWTPSDESTALKWTCVEWKDKRGEAGFRTVSAKFKQSFLLG